MAIVTREGSLFVWQRGFTIAGPTAGPLSQAGGNLLVLRVPGTHSTPPASLTRPHLHPLQLCFFGGRIPTTGIKSTFLRNCHCSSNQKYPGMILLGVPCCYEAKEKGVGGGGSEKSWNSREHRRSWWKRGGLQVLRITPPQLYTERSEPRTIRNDRVSQCEVFSFKQCLFSDGKQLYPTVHPGMALEAVWIAAPYHQGILSINHSHSGHISRDCSRSALNNDFFL